MTSFLKEVYFSYEVPSPMFVHVCVESCDVYCKFVTSTLPSPVEEKWKPTDPVVSSTFQSKNIFKSPQQNWWDFLLEPLHSIVNKNNFEWHMLLARHLENVIFFVYKAAIQFQKLFPLKFHNRVLRRQIYFSEYTFCFMLSMHSYANSLQTSDFVSSGYLGFLHHPSLKFWFS
jgi:hypothetical protein